MGYKRIYNDQSWNKYDWNQNQNFTHWSQIKWQLCILLCLLVEISCYWTDTTCELGFFEFGNLQVIPKWVEKITQQYFDSQIKVIKYQDILITIYYLLTDDFVFPPLPALLRIKNKINYKSTNISLLVNDLTKSPD